MTKLMQTADYSQQDAPEAQFTLVSRKTSAELTALQAAKNYGVGQFYYDTSSAVLKFSIDPVTLITFQNSGAAGSFTTLSAASTVSGTGFTNYMAAPPSIGTTTPGIVKTSNLQATFTDSTGTPGNVTNNSPRGRVALAAGASSITVTNSLVAATSMIIAMVRSVDGAATDIVTTTASAGSFVITMNAATTGTACVLDFLVVN